MFSHTVLIQIPDDAPDAFHTRACELANQIRATCPGLLSYAYGRNTADRGKHYNFAVVSTFVDEAAHDAYQVSDLHIQLKDHIATQMKDILACDLTLDDGA